MAGPISTVMLAGRRIFNALFPSQGPMELSVSVDFSFAASQGLHLTMAQETGEIDFIQTIWADNSLGAATLYIKNDTNGQQIQYPAGSVGYQPFLCGNPPKITVSCADTNSTATQIKFINVPISSQMIYNASSETVNNINTSQVSVTSAVTPIIAQNSARKGLIVKNAGSATIYIGDTNAVTTVTGYPLLPGDTLNFDIPNFIGPLWGVVATGTQLAGVLETAP